MWELTTISRKDSAGSGTTRRRRIRRWSPAAVLGEDDSWRRCGAPAVAWLGVEERGGRGGASGLVREARGRQWPRWGLSAATDPLGARGREDQRRGEAQERVRGGRGGAWRREGGPGRRGGAASRSWRGSTVRRARSCFSSWQEEEDSAAPGGLGRQVDWPGGLQVSQVRPR